MKIDSIQPPIQPNAATSPPRTVAVNLSDHAKDEATAEPGRGADGITRGGSPENDLRAAAARLAPAGATASTAISNTVKGTKSAQLAPHRYEVRSIPATSPNSGKANTSVAGVFDRMAGKPNATTGAPRGAFAVRFDQPHVGPGGQQLGHHLNYGTLPKDPHVEVPAAVVKFAGAAAHALEITERVAMPVTAAIDASRFVSAFAHDGGHVGAQTIETAGSVAGGWAGGLAGAQAGAAGGSAAGAAVGALFGGVGAVPGAALGGAIGSLAGGIAGSFGGSWLGAHAAATIEGQP